MTTKNILIVANTASMIKLFNMQNIKILKKLGCRVIVATNFINPGTISQNSVRELKDELNKLGAKFYQVNFLRRLGNIKQNYAAYKKLCLIIKNENIDLVHTHAPLSSIIARQAAHKTGVRCIYTSHGFQFYPHAPLKNWLIYYPIEYWFSHYTDAIITINSDDYLVAKKMKANHVYYIPGVGTNVIRAQKLVKSGMKQSLRQETRKKLGLTKDDFMLLSIGELSKRKNHETVIRAIAKLKNPHLKYFIAGIGPEHDHLLKLAKDLGVADQFFLLGFKKNVTKLYSAADLNCFLSVREGLGIGGLEGVNLGLYILATKYTGAKDYVTSTKTGILLNHPTNVNEVASAIARVVNQRLVAVPDYQFLKSFDYKNVNQEMQKIYQQELAKL